MLRTFQKLGGVLVASLSCTVGCGGNSDSGSTRSGGWNLSTGGHDDPGDYYPGATGGSTGGSVNTGGSRATGGAPATETSSVGGSVTTGGRRATGGTSATGGTVAIECNTLVNAAPPVTFEAIAEDMPIAEGGTIVSGTYYATSYVEYTGIGGSTTPTLFGSIQYLMVFSGCLASRCSFQGVTDVNVASTSIHVEANGTITTGGVSYTSELSCTSEGSSSGATGQYTSTGDRLITFDEETSTAVVYTRQL